MKKIFRIFCFLFVLVFVAVILAAPLTTMAAAKKEKTSGVTITWTKTTNPDKGKTFSYTIPESERSWYEMAPYIMIGILVAGMLAFALLNSPRNPGVQRTLELLEERQQAKK